MAKVACTSWSVIKIPIFLFFNCATILCMSSTAMGSTPAKGSSNSMKLGSEAKQRAISVLRLSPPESRSPLFLRTWPILNSSINDSSFIFCSFLERPVNCKTDIILSSTDNFLKTDASCAR